jgi:thiol-disulfide isomerase/thioredoxin
LYSELQLTMREPKNLYLPAPSVERRSSRIHGRYFAKNSTSMAHHCSLASTLLLLLTLLLTCTPLATKAQSCALYDPPVPGINCFHGDQVFRSITNSRTSWMIELYSSWCGHCQHFAPAMKELGKDVKQWSSVVRIGVYECTESKENQDVCSKFNIGGYPTIRVSYYMYITTVQLFVYLMSHAFGRMLTFPPLFFFCFSSFIPTIQIP